MTGDGNGHRQGGRLVIRGARWPADIAIEAGVITAVGEVASEPGDEELRCDGDIVTPGLINAHHHLYQWMTRGRATSCDLFSWLTELYPVWDQLTPDDVAAAATVGLAELALSGATTVADHQYLVPGGDDSVFELIGEAARKVGVRLQLSRGSMDLGESAGGLPPDSIVETIDEILLSTERIAAAFAGDDLITVVVAPCSPFSVSTELMAQSAELGRRLGLRLHTHLAETVEEVQDCLARFGCRPLELAERLGWVGPDVWFAHGIHFEDDEIARIGAAGAGIAHCPRSNGRLGSGICRVTDLRRAGAPVGLGVDGAASNEAGTLLPELQQSLFLARLRAGRADALSPAEALELATSGGASCLGRPDLGRIEPGAAADLAIWPADDLADIPDPVAGLVLGPDRRVRHLLVGGEPAVAGGEVVGLDVRAAHADLARRAKRLWPATQ